MTFRRRHHYQMQIKDTIKRYRKRWCETQHEI